MSIEPNSTSELWSSVSDDDLGRLHRAAAEPLPSQVMARAIGRALRGHDKPVAAPATNVFMLRRFRLPLALAASVLAGVLVWNIERTAEPPPAPYASGSADERVGDELGKILKLIEQKRRPEAIDGLKAFKKDHPTVPVPADIERELATQ